MVKKSVCRSTKKGKKKEEPSEAVRSPRTKKRDSVQEVAVEEKRAVKKLKIQIEEPTDSEKDATKVCLMVLNMIRILLLAYVFFLGFNYFFWQDWQLLINPNDYFVAKIGCSLSYDVIVQIKIF